MKLHPILVSFLVLMILPVHASDWTELNTRGMSSYLYTPTSAPKIANKRALMVSLHGCAQSNNDFKNSANWKSTADEYGMVVALPNVPNGGVYFSCWNYYGKDQSRAKKDAVYILELVDSLLNDESLNIDPNQVYISGLSSGGGQAMLMGCLAPDVFAGVGLNAGPTVGSEAINIGSPVVDLASSIKQCNTFAGAHALDLKTQISSMIYGSNDYTVSPEYNILNAKVYSEIFGATKVSQFGLSSLAGANTAGEGTLYSDSLGARVSLIQNTGLGHAWPSGDPAQSGSYINGKSINYPAYLTSFLFENNRRVERTPSVLRNLSFELSETSFSIQADLVETPAKNFIVKVFLDGELLEEEKLSSESNHLLFTYNTNAFGSYKVIFYLGEKILFEKKFTFLDESETSVSDNNTNPTILERVEDTALNHYLAGRLSAQKYSELYLKYGEEKFFVVKQTSGEWIEEVL